jgi:hypothetical protein
MCVIIHKPAGVELPLDIAERALKINQDGWGIMWHEFDRVNVRKGFKTKNFLRYVKVLKDKEAVFHCRIGTSGEVDVANCHPFPVTNQIWLMHNGVIGVARIEEEFNDSYAFAKYTLGPILQVYPELYGSPKLAATIQYFIGFTNKLVLMRDDGNIWIINSNGGTKHEGLWLSNSGPLPKVVIPHKQSYVYHAGAVVTLDDWQKRQDRFAPLTDSHSSDYDIYQHYCTQCLTWRRSLSKEDKWVLNTHGYICWVCQAKPKETVKKKTKKEIKEEKKRAKKETILDSLAIVRKEDLREKQDDSTFTEGWPEDLGALALLGKRAIKEFVDTYPDETAEMIDEYGFTVEYEMDAL